MHLIDKREKEMDSDERLKLEIMRTLFAGRGVDLNDKTVHFDFRADSNSDKVATFLMKRFNISFKDEKQAKILWKESDTIVGYDDELGDGIDPNTAVARRMSEAQIKASNTAQVEMNPRQPPKVKHVKDDAELTKPMEAEEDVSGEIGERARPGRKTVGQ